MSWCTTPLTSMALVPCTPSSPLHDGVHAAIVEGLSSFHGSLYHSVPMAASQSPFLTKLMASLPMVSFGRLRPVYIGQNRQPPCSVLYVSGQASYVIDSVISYPAPTIACVCVRVHVCVDMCVRVRVCACAWRSAALRTVNLEAVWVDGAAVAVAAIVGAEVFFRTDPRGRNMIWLGELDPVGRHAAL